MYTDADEILPGLWVGNWDAAKCANFLANSGIGYVLSLVSSTMRISVETMKHKVIWIRDQPGEDLLGEVEEIIKFIDEGLSSNSGVLVHCAMGVSRSSAAVVAYLMYKEKCTFETALQKVTEQHPLASPNEGFVEQLKLFEAMGCQCDPSHFLFKQHRLLHLADDIPTRQSVPQDLLASDPQSSGRDGDSSEELYTCRKCRRALFKQSSVIPHSANAGHTGFRWRKHQNRRVRGSQARGDDERATCTSVFIEPVAWMESFLVGVIKGKILCPKCSSRLGSFNWSGEMCSCGLWVTPAFQVHLSKVDHMKPLAR